MLTEKAFKVPIYDYRVEVVIFDDFKEVMNKYPHIATREMKGCAAECIGLPVSKLIVPHNDKSTLVHELEHIKNIIWKHIGYTPQVGNDEPDAYLMSYLVEQTDKVIDKHLASKC